MQIRQIMWFVVLSFEWQLCHGQTIQQDIEARNIELANDFAVDLVALSKDLPDRWMAIQRREETNTAQIDHFKVFVNFRTEIYAVDRKQGITYTYLTTDDSIVSTNTQAFEGFPMTTQSQVRTNTSLQQSQNDEWKVVPRIRHFGYPSTVPFHWCLGLLNSAATGSMQREDFLSGILWGQKRECLTASIEKQELVSFWGREGKNPYFCQINFDEKSRLVNSYALVKPFKESVTKEDIRARKFSVVEKGTVTWQVFPQLRGEDKEDLPLPVFIRIYSTMNKGEEIECTNEIEWKFGSDVQDSLLADPRTPAFKRPEF